MGFIRIHPADNVVVDTQTGHKQAAADIPRGADVVKYGFPIGHATADIRAGEHVHTHNLATNLGEKLTYEYVPAGGSDAAGNGVAGTTAGSGEAEAAHARNIRAFVRDNGNIGIRNDIWIVNTVGCVN